jgi:hypothetical protein
MNPRAQHQPQAEPQSRACIEEPCKHDRADFADKQLGDRSARPEENSPEKGVDNPCAHFKTVESFAFSGVYARIRRGFPVSGDRIILITLRGEA